MRANSSSNTSISSDIEKVMSFCLRFRPLVAPGIIVSHCSCTSLRDSFARSHTAVSTVILRLGLTRLLLLLMPRVEQGNLPLQILSGCSPCLGADAEHFLVDDEVLNQLGEQDAPNGSQ